MIHPYKFVLSRFIVIVAVVVGLAACTKYTYQKEGLWHILKPGETLDMISQKYAVSVKEIREINDIYDPHDLAPGMRIFIPEPKEQETIKPVVADKPVKKPETRFIWPVHGTISSGFGIRHGKMHEGIDITKDKGRDIRAAASGVVEFSGIKSGYGKTIILNHGGGYKTLYAHNEKNYVRKGMKVKQGVIIAKMGSSGKSIGIHLHFEVRYRNKPQNPLRFLPVR